MQNIFTSCPTPFNLGFPTYFVSNSFSLTRASLTLFEIAIPPGAENGSILDAMFTSSPIHHYLQLISHPGEYQSLDLNDQPLQQSVEN